MQTDKCKTETKATLVPQRPARSCREVRLIHEIRRAGGLLQIVTGGLRLVDCAWQIASSRLCLAGCFNQCLLLPKGWFRGFSPSRHGRISVRSFFSVPSQRAQMQVLIAYRHFLFIALLIAGICLRPFTNIGTQTAGPLQHLQDVVEFGAAADYALGRKRGYPVVHCRYREQDIYRPRQAVSTREEVSWS